MTVHDPVFAVYCVWMPSTLFSFSSLCTVPSTCEQPCWFRWSSTWAGDQLSHLKPASPDTQEVSFHSAGCPTAIFFYSILWKHFQCSRKFFTLISQFFQCDKPTVMHQSTEKPEWFILPWRTYSHVNSSRSSNVHKWLAEFHVKLLVTCWAIWGD